MISFSNIHKQYGKQLIFVETSFQLNPGEKVGLVGPNGAGKTTLFRMIVGDESPDEGTVSVSLVRTKTGARLAIHDDGNGMPESVDFEKSTGFGLRLMATLTEHLGGTIAIERIEGTTVTLDFPV